jgi:hypothetical protein
MPRRKMPTHARDFEHMNEEEILLRVLEDFKKAENFHSEFHEFISEWYRVYRAKMLDTEIREGRSNLFIPHTLANVETLKSKLVNAIFAERPFVSTKVLGVGERDIAEDYSKRMNNFLQYQFEQKMNIIPVVTTVILECLIAGVAVTRQNWKYRTKMVKRREAQTIDGKPIRKTLEIVEKEVVTHDHPEMVLVPYDMFFPDPTATDVDNALYTVEKEYMDYAEMLDSGIYEVDKVKKLKNDKDHNNTDVHRQLEASGIKTATEEARRGIELLHYCTNDWHIVVANRRVVVMKEANPYFHMEKPYAKWEIYPMPNMWWGISTVEILYNLQMELNTHRNQRIDNVSFILNKMHKVKRGANISESDLVSRPGGVVPVDELDDIEEMTFQDVTASAYTEEAIIKKDMDTVIGVHEINRGASSERRETATAMSITDQNSNERFTTAIKMIEFGGFKDAVAQIIQLNQQFITEDADYLVAGLQGNYKQETITPDEIALEYKLVGIGKSIGYISNRDVKQNQMSHLLNALTPFAEYINIPMFLEKILKIYELTDIDGLINDVEPQPTQTPQGGNEMNMNQPNQGQPMQGQGQAQGMGGDQDAAMKQMVSQIVQVLQQETQGKVDPQLLVRLVVDVLSGNPPQDPEIQPVVQRITELAQEMQGGGMM